MNLLCAFCLLTFSVNFIDFQSVWQSCLNPRRFHSFLVSRHVVLLTETGADQRLVLPLIWCLFFRAGYVCCNNTLAKIGSFSKTNGHKTTSSPQLTKHYPRYIYSYVGMSKTPECLFKKNRKPLFLIVSSITVFVGVLFLHQPGANHTPGASVTQVNHSVYHYGRTNVWMPRVKIKSFGWAANRNQPQHRLKFVIKYIYIYK